MGVRTRVRGASDARGAARVVIADADIVAFRAYLGEYGLDPGTIDTYVHQVQRCYAEGGPVERLKSRMAPKTKRLARAAVRHWAAFRDDPALRKAVDRVKLPAARRQAVKVPLSRETLMAVMREIETGGTVHPRVRPILGLMAFRGFRDGDVLRLQRKEVATALAKGTLVYEAKGGRYLEFRVLKTFRRWLEHLMDVPRWQRVEDLVSTSATPDRRRKAAARRVQRELAAIGRKLGIEGLHPHQLRRTYCVEYLRANKGDPEALIKLTQHMQWANHATALQYVDHLRGAELDSVAETMFDE